MKTEIIATLIRLGILIITGFIAPAFKAWLWQTYADIPDLAEIVWVIHTNLIT